MTPGGSSASSEVDPVEQHAHSLLEMLPVTAAFLLTALHWDQARTLTGRGRPDFGVRFKRRDPLSAPARVRLLAPRRHSGSFLTPRSYGGAGAPSRPSGRCRSRPSPATQTLCIPPGGDTPSAGQHLTAVAPGHEDRPPGQTSE
jgi:hypothetical protein